MESDLRTMIADYMERGFLENIVDMFLHDSSLYGLIGELIQDERVRVRLGVTALMEELAQKDKTNILRSAPSLMPLLSHHEPVVRGDAANLVGIAGFREAATELARLLSDENPNVRIIAQEALELLNSGLL